MQKFVLTPIEYPSKSSFLDELNLAQREAVLHGEGPLLVIAGAGSGKTKTLVYRVARLVEQGVDPASILLLTFTRKSSEEMLRRATAVLDDRCQKVAGGTFHSFANLILRQYGAYLGYEGQFTILDRGDSEDLIAMIRKDLGFAKLDKRFPKKSTIASVIGKAVNTGQPVSDVLREEYFQFSDFSDEIVTISEEYISHKQTIQVMDYDDLLVQLKHLLERVPQVREQLQRRYQTILVDEYQDTNKIQADILRCLVGEKRNIMVVGDDSQSIYSFRGAHFKNIMAFPDLFPGTRIVKLEENYRSVQPILDLTNAVIDRAKEKYAKQLVAFRTGGAKPVYVETPSIHTQSRFIVQKLLEFREQGIPLSKMAILIRSGWHSNELEVQFAASHIPFVKFGGFKFMETSHVKDVIAFMRIASNPKDSLGWHRVLLLLDGVGPKAAGDIIKAVGQSMLPETALSEFRKKSFYEDLVMIGKGVFGTQGKTPTEILKGVIQVYTPLFQSRYDDYHKRQSDVDSLVGISERYTDLVTFLTEVSLDPPEVSSADAVGNEDEKVTISTIHSAKGLEWKVVFLLSAVDGYLASFRSFDDPAQIEEERRLMYVALTRAEDHLFILKPHLEMTGQQYYRNPGMSLSSVSRFLSEGDLLRGYTDRWSLVEEVVKPQPVSKLPAYMRKPAPVVKSEVFYDSSRDGELTDDLLFDRDSRKYGF